MVSPLTQALAFQDSVKPTPSQVYPTNVVGAYNLASNVAEQNYQAQLAKQNAMWGGLAGLGGAGILAFGPKMAANWFGASAAPGAGSAASLASPLAGSGVVPTMPLAALSGDTAGSGILTGPAALGLPANAFASAVPGAATDAAMSGPLSSLMAGSGLGSIGGDFALANLGTAGAADAAGTVGADLAAAAAPAVATDALADAGAASLPDILAALLALA